MSSAPLVLCSAPLLSPSPLLPSSALLLSSAPHFCSSALSWLLPFMMTSYSLWMLLHPLISTTNLIASLKEKKYLNEYASFFFFLHAGMWGLLGANDEGVCDAQCHGWRGSIGCVVIEGNKVMEGCGSLTKACVLLMGLIYALNLEHPKQLKNTFEAFQKLFLELDGEKLLKKVHSLKSKLMQ